MRAALNVHPTESFPALELFEGLRSADFAIRLVDYAVEDMDDSVEAKTTFLRRRNRFCIALSSNTYARLEIDDPRARFTFAHELVHVMAHSQEIIQMAHMPHTVGLQRAAQHEPFYDSEWQADAGAAAILMPAEALAQMEAEGQLDVHAVMSAFGASFEAAKYRLDHYSNRKDQLLNLH